MYEPLVAADVSVTLVNASLLALWAALPGLVVSYTQQSVAARRLRPEFCLRNSEALELCRAVRLHERVCSRLRELNAFNDSPKSVWRTFLTRLPEIPSDQAAEITDLEAYAQHLRATIARLKRRPLVRLRSWVHVLSSKFALGRALAAHLVGLALLIVSFRVSGQQAWAGELTTGASKALVWYPLDEHLFYANAIATGFAAMAAPIFYLLRRMSLHRQYVLEFCTFTELAQSDPSYVVDQAQADPNPSQDDGSSETAAAGSWFAVLGLSASATIEEVKEAYKVLIKQNHPDRVHGMSAAFQKLAETETKKLNAAYGQGLIFAQPPAASRMAAPQ
jgi:hypothetical protein